jgi:hypothetical protein
VARVRVANTLPGSVLQGVAMFHKIALSTAVSIAVFALIHCIDLAEGHQPSTYITVRPVNTGQTYVPSLRLFRTPIAGRVQSMTVYRVAIIPFADFSHQQPFIRALEWGGNRTIIETLTDHFLIHGIGVALQDDLNALLVSDGLLRPPRGGMPSPDMNAQDQFAERMLVSNTPEYELIWGMHDSVTREELSSVVQSQDYLRMGGLTIHSASEPFLQGVTEGLPKDRIIELGRLLDVDLIIRGRILESGFTPSDPGSSVVQIRIYAQDAKTGELFWSNRCEFEVRPRTGWFSTAPGPRVLYDRAVREVITTLMADFFGER